MTTEDLSRITGVARELLLEMVDAGIFRRAVALKHGRPVFDEQAVEVVARARTLADQAAVGEISPAQAWIALKGL